MKNANIILESSNPKVRIEYKIIFFINWWFQGMLHPNELALCGTERGICMSIAVSVRDVCKRNPDRGVDIILSVAVCCTYFS